jgi:hypothetical protein
MEWRSVHELRPRASTSGGQSDGIANVAAAPVVAPAGFAVFLGLVPVMANQEDTSVQVRHLHVLISRCTQDHAPSRMFGAYSACGASWRLLLTVCHRGQAQHPWVASWARLAPCPAFQVFLQDSVPSSLSLDLLCGDCDMVGADMMISKRAMMVSSVQKPRERRRSRSREAPHVDASASYTPLYSSLDFNCVYPDNSTTRTKLIIFVLSNWAWPCACST